MLALVGIQNLLVPIVIISAVVILVGFILKLARQPSVISYIIVGIMLGPHGLAVVDDTSQVSTLGSLGLILLLFFVGMEMSLPQLIANWRISVIGTFLQVAISIAVIWFLGMYMEWGLPRILMMGFVLALSSTAVVLKLLSEWKEMHTRVGQNVVGILLTQDILIVVMLIVMNYLGGDEFNRSTLILQIIGGILIGAIMLVILKKKHIHLPFELKIVRDHEIQVFVALTICFGSSMIAEFMHLSAALGAFVGGIIVSATKATRWVQHSLEAFQVLFVSIFFVYIGMIIDIRFLWENLFLISSLVVSVLILNTLINGSVFVAFKIPWRQSFYAGALLSQIGEFSFVIGTVGYTKGLIAQFTFQLIISVIALTLFFSPMWIYATKKILKCTPLDDGIH